MFNTIIDTIQNGKKQFVNTFVTDKKFQAELTKLVDAQTEFTKSQVQSTLSIAEAIAKNAKEVTESYVAKFKGAK
jgi:predicted house-cleaning noncanonical NTP pyrophosphatase (MazG superfamily)